MDIDLIRTFEAICETRSFTAAARQVGRTQSAVSLQMKRLEEQIGRSLFIRGNPVELTPHGEQFSVHARRILDAYDDAMVAFDRRSVEGTVVLGLPSDYAPRILPLVLRRFVATYPLARVDIAIDESRHLVRRLAEGAVDLAFVTKGQGPTSSEEPVFREPVVWVGPLNDTHLADPVPLAIWSEDAITTRWMTEGLDNIGRNHRIAVTSPDITGLRAAVEAGLAVSVMAGCSVTERMHMLGAAEGFPTLPILDVMLERAHLKKSPVIDRLEQHLRQAFAPLEAQPPQS
jgi:DNA-binding transcriptional LysR family regulator